MTFKRLSWPPQSIGRRCVYRRGTQTSYGPPSFATVPPPETCEDLGFNCGPTGDGCGDVLYCGIGEDGGPATLTEPASERRAFSRRSSILLSARRPTLRDLRATGYQALPEIRESGGTFYRTYDLDDAGALSLTEDGGPANEADPATVGGFRLDKYEVTVGRFRE